MAVSTFSTENNTRTLVIMRFGSERNRQYKINMMFRETSPDGETFMRPMPMETQELCGLKFDEIQFVDPLGLNVQSPTELELIQYSSDRVGLQRSA